MSVKAAGSICWPGSLGPTSDAVRGSAQPIGDPAASDGRGVRHPLADAEAGIDHGQGWLAVRWSNSGLRLAEVAVTTAARSTGSCPFRPLSLVARVSRARDALATKCRCAPKAASRRTRPDKAHPALHRADLRRNRLMPSEVAQALLTLAPIWLSRDLSPYEHPTPVSA